MIELKPEPLKNKVCDAKYGYSFTDKPKLNRVYPEYAVRAAVLWLKKEIRKTPTKMKRKINLYIGGNKATLENYPVGTLKEINEIINKAFEDVMKK